MSTASFLEQMKINAAKKATEMAILELSCWDANPVKYEASFKEFKINATKRYKELEAMAKGQRVSVKAELVA